MLAVSFDAVTKRFGAQVLLQDASFQVRRGEKVGLIGPNGSGKTTLLNMLTGQESPTSGAVVVPKAVRVGYVTQYAVFEAKETALDCLLRDYRRVETALRQAEIALAESNETRMPEALAAYGNARDDYDRIDGDRLSQRARAMLDALGLAGKEEQPLASLSGGEKNVVSMAQALLANPDFLVLDEPGNHLDFLGIAWLEDFLNRFKGAVLIVSHNRYLLDRVVGRILHLEGGTISSYEGNYSQYRAQHLRHLLTQQAAYSANQKHLARLEAQLKRLQETARVLGDAASGQRYRAMRSRFEREKAQAVDRPVMGQAGVKAEFQTRASKADIALQIQGYSKRFGKLVLFENAETRIAAGERVALVGPNGSGKTTLLRDIVAHANWEHDTLRIGPSFRLGYGAQQQEQLVDERSVLQELLAAGSLTREAAIALLDRFSFAWEDTQKRVSDLSGGERNRLQLAKLMVQRPNFLILDEPTNHLDIPTCEAVEDALEEYDGTLLVVSHDRYFLDKVVQRVIEVKDHKLVTFPGNFSAFWQARRQADDVPAVVGRVTRRRKQRENVYKKEQQDKALKVLEQRIADVEAEKVELESRIANAFSSGNHQKGRRLANQLDHVKDQLDSLYEQWETLEK